MADQSPHADTSPASSSKCSEADELRLLRTVVEDGFVSEERPSRPALNPRPRDFFRDEVAAEQHQIG